MACGHWLRGDAFLGRLFWGAGLALSILGSSVHWAGGWSCSDSAHRLRTE
jgi:hypothetical protein